MLVGGIDKIKASVIDDFIQSDDDFVHERVEDPMLKLLIGTTIKKHS